MSKKEFELIASVLRVAHASDLVIELMALTLAKTYVSFSPSKFRYKCRHKK